MKRINNTSKILLVIFLSLTMGLTGCSSNSNEKNGTTEVKTERDFTPLEKEISKLKDFQKTDKVYDNKDLELFNKIQGYLYSVNEQYGRDSVEIIELIPPTKEGLAELEKYGENYKFISNVIIPCCFQYTDEREWVKRYPTHMNEEIKTYWHRADPKYLYATQEELMDFVSSNLKKKEWYYQFEY